MPELTPQPTPVQAIYDMYRSDLLVVNRTYQRKLVWTLVEKQKLIDSVLSRYPIPLILLSETKVFEKPGYEIIDGLQRLHTIISFIEQGFSLADGRYFDLDQFSSAKNAASEGYFQSKETDEKLGSAECGSILNYVVSLSVMRDATNSQIQDVFDRVNSYGHRLSEQEKRQAGLITRLASFTRKIACRIRGDDSRDILLLSEMPSISIDLPKSKHGFGIEAKDCFWVKHGILRSTDLRDSMDEHLIADIACCVVNGQPIERSVDALDAAFDINDKLGKSIDGALFSHGEDKLGDEIFYVISEIDKVVSASNYPSLRRLIFKETTTNAYPSVFTLIFLAFYRHSIINQNKIVDYQGLAQCLNNISANIETGRSSVTSRMRLKNLDSISGIIAPAFGGNIDLSSIYGAPSLVEFENIIRNSPVENSALEFKQGLAKIEVGANYQDGALEKVLQTICAIANIGPSSHGHLYLGVADKRKDAERIEQLDNVKAVNISERYVVGVGREAERVGSTLESYFTCVREKLRNSKLSDSLKQEVLSAMKMVNYHGRVVLDIGVPAQTEMSFYEDKVYLREGDQTKLANPKQTVNLALRFK